MEGEGTIEFQCGDKYAGSFLKSKFSGYGKYLYSTGLEIVGFFLSGKCCRYGRKTFCDGRVYIGEMSFDVPHGRGKMIKANGGERFGYWEKGIYKGESNNEAKLAIDADEVGASSKKDMEGQEEDREAEKEDLRRVVGRSLPPPNKYWII